MRRDRHENRKPRAPARRTIRLVVIGPGGLYLLDSSSWATYGRMRRDIALKAGHYQSIRPGWGPALAPVAAASAAYAPVPRPLDADARCRSGRPCCCSCYRCCCRWCATPPLSPAAVSSECDRGRNLELCRPRPPAHHLHSSGPGGLPPARAPSRWPPAGACLTWQRLPCWAGFLTPCLRAYRLHLAVYSESAAAVSCS